MKATALFFSVFVIATCGLVYELVAGALASYLLGDSVTQFSLIIGAYLSAMGLGSWLSKFVRRGTLTVFISVEIGVGLIGGCSATLLFLAFGFTAAFRPLLYLLVGTIGTLVGLEIPLLLHILKERFEFKDLIANVLFLDYIGALAASILFPFLFVPSLGLVQTAYFFGIANTLVALWASRLFEDELPRVWPLRTAGLAVLALLLVGFASADKLTGEVEKTFFDGTPIHTRTSPYQRIVVTHSRGDLRLYLSGHLQFSSKDEHRYHEALVHPAMSLVPGARRALVLGGGDGFAVRELLKYSSLETIQLVDLDPAMTELFRDEPMLAKLNGGSLADPRVKITNADALRWLEEHDELFDVIVVDLPDPSNYSLGKLYSRSFYRLAREHLRETGALAVQSTSPWHAPLSYGCIVATIGAAGFETYPYHCFVPSFGEWGYVLALKRPRPVPGPLAKVPLRFLDQRVMESLFVFPPDMAVKKAKVNFLDTQALVAYYNREWTR